MNRKTKSILFALVATVTVGLGIATSSHQVFAAKGDQAVIPFVVDSTFMV